MIYLTNDTQEHAIYFELQRIAPRRTRVGTENRIYGLLGNGISEIDVTIRSWQDHLDMDFGSDALFEGIEEGVIRRLLGEAVRELTVH